MTNQTTNAPKAATFYGISAKHFLAVIAAENNPKTLADMLAFAAKRVTDHAVKHPSRVKRWERVRDAITAKLNGTPSPALAGAATFAAKPLSRKSAGKPAAKAKKSAKPNIDAIIAASGMTPEALMLQLAARV